MPSDQYPAPPPSELKRLTREDLERSLSSPTLEPGQRGALMEELSSRIAEEVLAGRDVTSPRELHSSSHSFEPRRVAGGHSATTDPRAPGVVKQGEQWPREAIGQAGTQVPARPSPGKAPHIEKPRHGFSRALAALAALVVVALGAWGAITALNTMGDDPNPPAPSPTPPEPTSVIGPVGEAQVQWSVLGVTYNAFVQTDGSGGVADVTFVDPGQGLQVTIREELSFGTADGGYAYTGSDPRDAVSGEAINYSPDTFYVTQTSAGWEFTQVCDEQDVCGPVR